MRSIFALVKSWFAKLFQWVGSIFGKEVGFLPDDPIVEPDTFPGEVICYYGCPNSKKAHKLQLNRRLYK